MLKVGVTVWLPVPVFTAALKSLVAGGALAAAGSVYGYVIELDASVHVEPLSQLTVGGAWMVVAPAGSVLGMPAPLVKVVDVAEMFQPAVELPPPTSRARVPVRV
jgi:hypothetical protein